MSSSISSGSNKEGPAGLERFLSSVYETFHKPEYIDPDPLVLVRRYPKPEDREIAALVCSSLALGRVGAIVRAGEDFLGRFGPNLRDELLGLTDRELGSRLEGFGYRFFDAAGLASLLGAVAGILKARGSLEACFLEAYRTDQATVLPALTGFVRAFGRAAGNSRGTFLADPAAGSASKRLHLFLRWMVRKDAVDPGGWSSVSPAKLLVPLDTHIHAFSRRLGLTSRGQADAKTVLEVTEAFRRFSPEDPVRYDFSLSRLGLHPEAKYLRETLFFNGNFSGL